MVKGYGTTGICLEKLREVREHLNHDASQDLHQRHPKYRLLSTFTGGPQLTTVIYTHKCVCNLNIHKLNLIFSVTNNNIFISRHF